MKSLFFLSAIVLLITTTSYKKFPSLQIKENGVDLAKQWYVDQLEAFQYEVVKLKKYLEHNVVDHAELKHQTDVTREAFKKVEFLMDYIDPEFTVKNINGAPLPKLMPHVPEITVISPKGLQTIDELVYADHIEVDELKNLVTTLNQDLDKWIPFQRHLKMSHRLLIEGARYNVIRIYTLGLTGFDTPGSSRGIEESIVAYQSMLAYLDIYNPLLEEDNRDLFNDLKANIEGAIKYLESQEFEKLDRVIFYKQYTAPQFAMYRSLQSSLGIESIDEVSSYPSAHDYDKNELFDEEFFNLSYYTKLANSDLNNEKIIALGRDLFYDVRLSSNNMMSCATCHDPKKAFTDNTALSPTNQHSVTTRRNTPTLINSALSPRYFWDMREYSLERQIKHVMNNEHEFNINFVDLSDKLLNLDDYKEKFEEAYGQRDKYKISSWSISNSLAAYIASLTSYNSSFDRYMRGEAASIDERVINGYNLFMGKAACGTCHFAPTFSGVVPPYFQEGESEVLGVPAEWTNSYEKLVLDADPGRIANGMTEEEVYFYHHSFKTPSVRNVQLTAPYMHNGALPDLESVMEFYNEGGGAGLGLNVPHQTLPESKLELTAKEKEDIILFMESLTDIGVDY